MKQEFSPDTLPYHLIVPSLPGYAFSSTPPLDKDFNTGDIARVMNSLMTELGFGNGYVAQGGDIGSYVGRVLGTEYQACKAVHSMSHLHTGISPLPLLVVVLYAYSMVFH